MCTPLALLFLASTPSSGTGSTPATARTKWSFTAASDKLNTPVVSPDGNTVFVGSDRDDMHVYALRTADGQLRWAFNASEMPCFQGYRGDISRLVMSQDGDVLYFGVGLCYFGVNAADGSLTLSWNIAPVEIVGAPVISPDGQTLYAAFVSYAIKTICALDLTLNKSIYAGTNDCRWTHSTWVSEYSPPVVSPDGTLLYFGSEEGIATALLTSNGTKKWGFQVYWRDVGRMVPSLDGETVYFSRRGSTDYYALNASNGSKRWVYRYLITSTAPVLSPDGRTVYIGVDGDGASVIGPDGRYHRANSTVVAVDATSGRAKWSFSTSSAVTGFAGPPVASEAAVYFGSALEGRMWSLDASEGSEKFSINVSMSGSTWAFPQAALSPDAKTIFVVSASNDKCLYAFGTSIVAS